MENQDPQNRRITRHFIRDAAGTKRTAVFFWFDRVHR